MTKVFIAGQLPAQANTLLLQSQLVIDTYTGDNLISHAELIRRVADADFLIILVLALITSISRQQLSARFQSRTRQTFRRSQPLNQRSV